MKSEYFLIAVFLIKINLIFCQQPKIEVYANKTYKDFDVWLYKAIPGEKDTKIQKTKFVKSKATFFLPKQTEPFFAYVKLQLNDSVIGHSYFLVTNSVIQIKLDSTLYQGNVSGGENDFMFKHWNLLFDLPSSINRHPDFTAKNLTKNKEFATQNFVLNGYWKEYESNIYETIKDHKSYFFVLQKFFDRKTDLPLNVLKRGYSFFADSLKKTFYGRQLQEYISYREVLQIGEVAPSFFVTDKDGKSIESSKLYSGNKIILIDFWASWCGPCREEMRKLKSKFHDIDTSKIRIISISIDDHKDYWVNASIQEGILWESYLAPGGAQGDISKKFCLNFIPRTFLINQDGIIMDFDLRTEELGQFFTQKSLWREHKD